MYELALCSGIGGLSLGLQRSGVKPACYVERNPYRVNVLISRFNDGSLHSAPIWDDVTSFDGRPWCGRVDIISAGFPCQPFSKSGLRRGSDDERYLWPDIYRIVCEVQPRFVLLENVSGLLDANKREHLPAPLSGVLADLARIGFDAEWQMLSAHSFGAPHERKRIFIVGYPHQSRWRAILCPFAEIGIEAYSGWPTIDMDTSSSCLQAMEDRTCQSAIFRGNDGTAHRVERLASIGESVVPQVAEYIGKCILRGE